MSQDDKNTKTLREMVSKSKMNKICAECGERMPNYVCLNFNTFVCTLCSGILREFNFRVKSISMSSFSKEDMTAIIHGGNSIAAKYWTAKRAKHETKPTPGQSEMIRKFIKRKYVEKTWIEFSNNSNGESSSIDSEESLELEVNKNIVKKRKEIKKKKLSKQMKGKSRLSSSSGSMILPAQKTTEIIPGASKLVLDGERNATFKKAVIKSSSPYSESIPDLLGLDGFNDSNTIDPDFPPNTPLSTSVVKAWDAFGDASPTQPCGELNIAQRQEKPVQSPVSPVLLQPNIINSNSSIQQHHCTSSGLDTLDNAFSDFSVGKRVMQRRSNSNYREDLSGTDWFAPYTSVNSNAQFQVPAQNMAQRQTATFNQQQHPIIQAHQKDQHKANTRAHQQGPYPATQRVVSNDGYNIDTHHHVQSLQQEQSLDNLFCQPYNSGSISAEGNRAHQSVTTGYDATIAHTILEQQQIPQESSLNPFDMF